MNLNMNKLFKTERQRKKIRMKTIGSNIGSSFFEIVF